MYERILIRYGELSLKKDNRHQFIKLVNNHIKNSLKDFPHLEYVSEYMRFSIILNGEDIDEIIDILKLIPGIHSFSKVRVCNSSIDDIKNLAYEMVKDLKNQTIKVETNRGNKLFPMTSLEITKAVAGYLFKNIEGLKADVHHPEATINIDVRDLETYIYKDIIMGLGGLPSKSLASGLLLISGGIDSPVAGVEAIKRGMEVEAIHFESSPYTSPLALQKVIDLLQIISNYKSDQKIILHIVPFTELQETIYQEVRDDYCITIMRRMMYRIASQVLEKRKLLALITGENIGQVASQTIESLNIINQVTNHLIIRPLVTLDKQEIINKAINYKTYEVSIRPYEDCCTVFVPKHPQIKPNEKQVLIQEAKFDYNQLIEKALNNINTIVIKNNEKYNVLDQSIDDNIF